MKQRTKWWGPVLLGLSGCSSGPPVRTYVLAPPLEQITSSPRAAASIAVSERLVVRRVVLPDYLDTTDFLLREGLHEVKVSATARWGERLSEGLTHALAADLASRLAPDSIGLAASSKTHRQLVVDVSALELWSNGRCVLAATWSLGDHGAPATVMTGRGTFEATPSGDMTDLGDARLVAGISLAVSQLADAIAPIARESTGRSVRND